jgi:hypothetical protein
VIASIAAEPPTMTDRAGCRSGDGSTPADPLAAVGAAALRTDGGRPIRRARPDRTVGPPRSPERATFGPPGSGCAGGFGRAWPSRGERSGARTGPGRATSSFSFGADCRDVSRGADAVPL